MLVSAAAACALLTLLPAHGAIPELADGGTYATGQTNRNAQASVRGAAYPPQWLPVLLLAAAPSPPPPPFVFTGSLGLRLAAQEFDIDPAAAIARYGPIADWDVSAISGMRGIFNNLLNFNADISSWDTSSVTEMAGMFNAARSFNQPLSFDTSSVTDMTGMFAAARSFNQPLSFDTSSVTAMMGMFQVSSSLPPLLTLLRTGPSLCSLPQRCPLSGSTGRICIRPVAVP